MTRKSHHHTIMIYAFDLAPRLQGVVAPFSSAPVDVGKAGVKDDAIASLERLLGEALGMTKSFVHRSVSLWKRLQRRVRSPPWCNQLTLR